MPSKPRLDALLVERGLAESREKAQRLIRAGLVSVAGRLADKPGASVAADAPVEVAPSGSRFVSRGGEKLQAALDRFSLSPRGAVCLDIGASTGGFTDCLLQAGARMVYAVDVGHGQLHEKLRADSRVIALERVNARALDPESFPAPIAFCVIDVSFISLLKIIPSAARLLQPGANLVALVKPQFEAGREHVRRGGRVMDPQVHRETLRRVLEGIVAEGFAFHGVTLSPARGPAGNWEYLAWFRHGAGSDTAAGLEGLIAAVVAEAFPAQSIGGE